jgi:hypothetical protein
LSSARVVRCSVKSGNERNPCRVLYMSRETAQTRVHEIFSWPAVWEEGGDDVKSAWPFDTLGNTRDTMAGTEGCQVARRSQSQKTGLSSDRSLQLDSLKLDSLVIGDQNAPVNTFSDLVLTARHTKRVGNTRRPCFIPGTTVGSMIRVKS